MHPCHVANTGGKATGRKHGGRSVSEPRETVPLWRRWGQRPQLLDE